MSYNLLGFCRWNGGKAGCGITNLVWLRGFVCNASAKERCKLWYIFMGATCGWLRLCNRK